MTCCFYLLEQQCAFGGKNKKKSINKKKKQVLQMEIRIMVQLRFCLTAVIPNSFFYRFVHTAWISHRESVDDYVLSSFSKATPSHCLLSVPPVKNERTRAKLKHISSVKHKNISFLFFFFATTKSYNTLMSCSLIFIFSLCSFECFFFST